MREVGVVMGRVKEGETQSKRENNKCTKKII